MPMQFGIWSLPVTAVANVEDVTIPPEYYKLVDEKPEDNEGLTLQIIKATCDDFGCGIFAFMWTDAAGMWHRATFLHEVGHDAHGGIDNMLNWDHHKHQPITRRNLHGMLERFLNESHSHRIIPDDRLHRKVVVV